MSLVDELDLLNGPIGFRNNEEICRTLLQMSRNCAERPKPVDAESIFDKIHRLSSEVEALGWAAFRIKEFPERAAAFNELAREKEIELKALIAERRAFL